MIFKNFIKLNSFSILNNFNKLSSNKIKNIQLNFGPQHPASHGILRLNMQLSGEFILKLDPQFGLLHRGTEKLIEIKSYIQALPYFDRFDYVSNLFQEHIFCLSIEQLINDCESFDYYINIVRTLFDELSRVLNHLLTISATILDIGAMGSIFWAFEERERIMEFFERISGARMHTAVYKPNFFDWSSINESFILDLSKFLLKCNRLISGAFLALLNNRILKTRLSHIGIIQPIKIKNYGITGLIARSSGFGDDLRLQKSSDYGAYWYLSIRSFIGKRGDNYDRFIIRIKEIFESFRIISQLVLFLINKDEKFIHYTKYNKNKQLYIFKKYKNFFFFKKLFILKINFLIFKFFFFKNFLNKLNLWNNYIFSIFNTHENYFSKLNFFSMESVINHFKYFSEGFNVPSGLSYQQIESPKGYLGVFLISDNSEHPYRCKIRTPVSHNMNILPSVCTNLMLADFVATFCSLDIVLGEIDR